MRTKNSYFSENWFQLVLTVILTLLPIGICLVLIINYSNGYFPIDQWFHSFGIQNNHFYINDVLLLFIVISYFSLFANLFIYLLETESKAFNYRGSNPLFQKLNLLSLFISLLILIGIPVFILKTTDYEDILHFNRYLSIFVFLAFTITDGLMWYQECLAGKTLRDPVKIKLCKNNIAFSKKSILLINFPALLILSFAWIIHYCIAQDPFFKTCKSCSTSVQIENFNLFIDGFETSVIFTSIVITQIVFAVLKIKWSYRKYQIENYFFDPPPQKLNTRKKHPDTQSHSEITV